MLEALIAKVLLDIDRSQRNYEVNINRAQKEADFWNAIYFFFSDLITVKRLGKEENCEK